MSDLSEMKTWLRESDSTEWNGPYLVKVAEALERLEAELAVVNAHIAVFARKCSGKKIQTKNKIKL